jgi:protein-S-isoprenylcysteine O-methyltransferase Ste14
MSDAVRHAEGDAAKVWVLPPALYLAALGLGVVLHWLVPLGFAEGSTGRVILGVAAVGVGLAIIRAAFSIFRRIGQDPNPRTPTPVVTREGPYRFTRNPMYLGLSLILFGLGVARGNGWIVVMLAPTLAIMHYGVILPEERYLERKFGEEYARFRASVRRWI